MVTLTPPERQVLALFGEGLLDSEIAQRLHITPSDVKQHFTSICRKAEVSNRLELLIFAYASGLIDPPA